MTEMAMASPLLTTETITYQDQVVMVICRGRLVAGTEDAFYATVRALMPGQKRIILHLAELQHTDSRGLGALVRLYVAGKSAGCSVELAHLSRQIQHLLHLTRLFQVITVIDPEHIDFM